MTVNKKRICLKCEEPFISEGPHNRICNACKHRNRTTDLQRQARSKWASRKNPPHTG